MGKPKQQRSSETDALSLHTTPDDYEYDDLPSYTDSEAATTSNTVPRPLLNPPTLINHSPPSDEYAAAPVSNPRWLQIGNRGVNLAETSIRIDDRLTDPYQLYAYIMDVVRMIPPKPMIRIHGYHYEQRKTSDSKKKEKVEDFDVCVSLQPMLRTALEQDWWSETIVQNDDKAYRGGFRKTRATGHTQGVQLSDEPVPDLKEWCEQYCTSPSKLKVFRITREVHGLDNNLLETAISGMIRATEYRGRLEITFPIDDKHVDIYTPHIINHWRTTWVRFLFYFSMLWIITWPVLFFVTKWYAVYNVLWNFSVPDSNGERRYACMSERQWFECQKNYLKHLILNRFSGQADTNPAVINEFNNRPEPTRASTGNTDIDSAVTFVAQGVNVWNQVRGGHSRPTAGAWGYDC